MHVCSFLSQLRLIRKERNGTLYVDDKKEMLGQSVGGATNINGLKTVYLGGVPLGFEAKRVPVCTGNRLILCIWSHYCDHLSSFVRSSVRPFLN